MHSKGTLFQSKRIFFYFKDFYIGFVLQFTRKIFCRVNEKERFMCPHLRTAIDSEVNILCNKPLILGLVSNPTS